MIFQEFSVPAGVHATINTVLLTIATLAITYSAAMLRQMSHTVTSLDKRITELGVFLFGPEQGTGGGLVDRVKILEEKAQRWLPHASGHSR
jgi:hypothetical protein